jgi:hypothetical protein
MMGFDEAVDAEEWGMRETNNEAGGRAAGRGRGKAARDTDAQDEKNRKVHRTISLRKGPLSLKAVDRSEPAKKKAAKSGAKKTAKKKAAKKSARPKTKRR